MLLKKILNGETRVRYVICQQEGDNMVSLQFCRWRPLGPKAGEMSHTQYRNRAYFRNNPHKILSKLNRICKSRNPHFSYTGNWWITFYAPEIKEILFRHITTNLVWYYFLVMIILHFLGY